MRSQEIFKGGQIIPHLPPAGFLTLASEASGTGRFWRRDARLDGPWGDPVCNAYGLRCVWNQGGVGV